jgi:hypothetical protein
MRIANNRKSVVDRRSGVDRRKVHLLEYFIEEGVERRGGKERRRRLERRVDWVRVDDWYSICLGAVTKS